MSLEKLIEDAQDKDEAIQSANEEIVEMLKQETNKVLNKVLYIRSLGMKNAFNRSDNWGRVWNHRFIQCRVLRTQRFA